MFHSLRTRAIPAVSNHRPIPCVWAAIKPRTLDALFRLLIVPVAMVSGILFSANHPAAAQSTSHWNTTLPFWHLNTSWSPLGVPGPMDTAVFDINAFDTVTWNATTGNRSAGRLDIVPNHWRNVERNGLQLCILNGADETVVRLFALFHDVERRNDGLDPNHGRRAADLVQDYRGTAYLRGIPFEISDPQLELLVDACRYHNDGLTSSDLTIGTCWDADRMDLPRVGIIPNPAKMSTPHGKEYATRGSIALNPAPPNGRIANE